MSLDDRLAGLRDRLEEMPAPDAGPGSIDAALARTRNRVSRRRRRRATVVGFGLVLVAALGAAGVAQVVDGGGDRSVGVTSNDGGESGGGLQLEPPPTERSQPYLFVTEPLIPASGADVAFIVVNPTDTDVSFGVGSTLQRWDVDGRWVDVDSAGLCLEEWRCTGKVGQTDFQSIGLLVGAEASGPTLWLGIDDLETGHYRLVTSGSVEAEGEAGPSMIDLAGQFTVAERAQEVPRADHLDDLVLRIDPPRLPSAAEADSAATVSLSGPDRRDPAGLGEPDQFPDTVTGSVEAWSGDAWTPIGDVDLERTVPTDEQRFAVTYEAPLPTRLERSYRLVIEFPDESTAEGRYWLDVPRAEPPTTEEQGPDPWSAVAPGFAVADAGPLAPRNEAAVVAADGAMVVWGGDIEGFNVGRPELGDVSYDDGAVFRSESGWTPMAPSPLPPIESGPVGVARGPSDPLLGVDGDVVIAGGSSVAAYDPLTDTWSPLPDLPEQPEAMYWTGETVLAVTSAGGFLLEGDAWQPIATAPDGLDLGEASLAWTGSQLFAFGVPSFAYNGPLRGQAWNAEEDIWSALPEVALNEVGPLTGTLSRVTATWTGSEVVVADGYRMGAAGYDPAAGTWRSLPSIPMASSEGGPELMSVDGRAVALRYEAVAILDGDRWVPLPAEASMPRSFSAVVGPSAYGFDFGYGPDGADTNIFGRFTPADALAGPERVPLGSLELALGEGDRLLGAAAETTLGRAVAIRAELSTTDGTCRINLFTSYLGPLEAAPTVDPDGTIRVRAVAAASPPAPDTTEAGRSAGSIECSDPADVERVVSQLTSIQT